MPFADNAGVPIHYQVEGSGPPLVLQHGFTDSLESWAQYGYVAALRADFRVIRIDARGHGASGKPHDPAAYTLDRRTADVTVVLDVLGIAKADFWGYSMGAWIGFGMAKYAPGRVERLVLGGQHPFARDQSAFRQWLQTGIDGGPDVLVAAFETMVGPISAAYAARLRAADPRAWLAAVADRDDMGAVLETMTMPCCLYAGDADPIFAQAKIAADRIRNSRFFALPGMSHLQAMVAGEQVLSQVVPFLTQGR